MQSFEHIAQSIVEQFSSILDIPISITDKTGIIIGSTDSKRLGSYHAVTSEVTKSGKTIFFSKEQTSELVNVLPGIATPLSFQQQTVGVLGLIGDPAVVERYVEFVQAHIEMLLMERFRTRTVVLQMETMRDFIHALLSYKKEQDLGKLHNYSEMIGFSLDMPRSCILIETSFAFNQTSSIQHENTFNRTDQDLFLCLRSLFVDNEKDIIAPLNVNQWIVLKHVNNVESNCLEKKLEYVFNALQSFCENRGLASEIKISYGNCYSTIEGVIHSYKQSSKALSIIKRNNLKVSIISNDDWKLLSLALVEDVKLPARRTLDYYIEKICNHTNGTALIDNYLVYCEEQMNTSKAARKLFIHRNTLLYRLQQLQELLNINLQSFDQCMLLYLTLKQHKHSKFETAHTTDKK